MTKTICMLAALTMTGAASLFAQERPMPPPPEKECPPAMCEQMMSPEAKKQIQEKEKEIRAIRKAEMEKIRAKRDAMMKLVEDYKAYKDDATKAKIMAELGSMFDSQMKMKQDRLDAEKARKDEVVNRMFDAIINGKPCPKGHAMPKDRRHRGDKPGPHSPEGDRPMPPPPPAE